MQSRGARIRYIRKEILKLSGEEFAQQLEVRGGKGVISSWENDISIPEVPTLLKISQLAGVTVDWILKGKSQNYINESHTKYGSIDDAIKNTVVKFPEYPIVSLIAAGKGDLRIQDYPEYESLQFDPRKYFWLKIDEEYGFSMMPSLRPGEKVLCAFETKKFKDRDMVAVLYDKTKGAIKILNRDHNFRDIVVLESLNPTEKSMMLNKSQVSAMYKVVLILKI